MHTMTVSTMQRKKRTGTMNVDGVGMLCLRRQQGSPVVRVALRSKSEHPAAQILQLSIEPHVVYF